MADPWTEVVRFRVWADNYPPGPRSGEWECDYGHWNDLYAAVLNHVAASPPEAWSDEALQPVLYAIARDNECQYLAHEVRLHHPATLIALARAAWARGEPEAKWQLADELGHLGDGGGAANQLPLILARDEHEHVRRRALGALARAGSPAVEPLALEAWHRPDEHQEWARMMALDGLHRISSPHLEPLLAEAERDERQHLRDFAKRIRQGKPTGAPSPGHDEAPVSLPLAAVFDGLPGPRRQTRNKLHRLTDILVIAPCAIIGGAESWEAIAEYGRTKAEFFRRFLPLGNGIPSPDTFERVFVKLDPGAFAQAFGRWMAAACEATGLIPIAIDGKSARRAKQNTAAGCLTVVSAWATENRLTLGQVAVPDGSNEIGVIPELLRTLDLAGAIVTIDAAGCQLANAEIIRGQGGHYLFAVKANQPALRAAVERVVEEACEADFVGVTVDGDEATDDAHGRHEERYVTVISDPEGIPADWPDVAAVVQVNREREVGGKRTCTSHYHLTSYAGTAAEIAGLVRGHWCLENSLHWVLDVVFREDAGRVRAGHSGENLAMIRRAAVALLRRAPGEGTTPTKRLKAGWDQGRRT